MAISAKETSSLTGALLFILIFISFGYFLYVNIKLKQPKLLQCLTILTIFFLIYGVIDIFFGINLKSKLGNEYSNIDFTKKVCASLLVVYPFYVFALKGQLTHKTIIRWLPFFIILAIFVYIQQYYSLLDRAIKKGSIATEFTNNMGYLVLSLLPLLFIKQKIIYQYIGIGICAILIVAAVKRGAILIGCVLIVYFLYSKIKLTTYKNRKRVVIITLLILLLSGYFIDDFVSHSEYIQYRFNHTMDGDVSGRDSIYSTIIDQFFSSDIFALLFGHGANSSIYFAGILAHNDWLEVLINQGIMGIFLYAIYFGVMFRTWRRYKANREIGLCFGSLFLILFLRSFFSMSYTEYSLFICVAYGYCLAYITPKSEEISNNAR